MTTPAAGSDRDGPRPHLAEISGVADFAAALTELRVRAGMSIRNASRASGIPPATLGGYFSGRHLPTVSQGPALTRLLVLLGVPGAEVDAWHDTLARLRRSTRGPRGGSAVSPYRGLECYQVVDAPWFVGREAEVDRLVSLVQTVGEAAPPRAICVVGSSGSGKSSLLRAGFAAVALDQGTTVAVTAPGAQPREALARALTELEGSTGPTVLVVDQLEEVLAGDIGPDVRLGFLELLAREAGRADGPVLVLGLRADFFGAAVAEPAMLPLLTTHQVVVAPMEPDAMARVITEPAARAGRAVEDELVPLLLRDVSARGARVSSALPLLSHALLTAWETGGPDRLGVAAYLATGGVAGAVQRSAERAFAGLGPSRAPAVRRLFRRLVSIDEEGLTARRRVAHEDLEDLEDLEDAGDAGDAGEVVEAFLDQRILTATETTLEISHEVLLDAWPRLREWVAESREDLLTRRRVAAAFQEWVRCGHDDSALLGGGPLALAEELAERDHGILSAAEQDFLRRSLDRRTAAVREQGRRQRRLRLLLTAVAVLALVATGLSTYLAHAVSEADAQRRLVSQARDEALSRQVALQATRLRESDPATAMQLSLAALDLAPTVEATSTVLDATSAGLATRLVGPEGGAKAATSPDGALLARGGADGQVLLHDARTPDSLALLAEVDPRGGAVHDLEFSSSGDQLAVGTADGTVVVYDVTDPTRPTIRVGPLGGPRAAVQAVAFDPGGTRLWAATSDPGLFGWRLAGGTARSLAAGTEAFGGSVQAVDVAPDGRIATGSTDARVRIWRFDRGRLSLQATRPVGSATNAVTTVAFSPDGSLLAAGARDRRVRVWDVRGRLTPATTPLAGFPSYVNDLAFDADGGRLAVAGSSGAAQVWSTRSWTRSDRIPGDVNYTSVAFLVGADRLVTASVDGVIRLWTLAGPRVTGLGDTVWSLSYTADGQRLYLGVGNQDPQVVEMDVSDPSSPRRTGRVLRGPPEAGVLDGVAAVSPQGDLVVAGTLTGGLVVWRQGGGSPETPTVIRAADELIENVQFSPDGESFAVAADDGTVAVYGSGDDDTAPRLLHSFDTGTVTVGLAFSPDGGLLAAGTAAEEVRLWSLAADRPAPLSRLTGFENDVMAVTFSPDGQTLLAGGVDRAVRRWDISDPRDPRPLGEPLRGPTDTVWGISLSPDGQQMGVASTDGRLWLWSLAGDDPVLRARLEGLAAPAFQVARHPTRPGFAAAGAGGVATYWTTDVARARAAICAAAGTPLTRAEWTQFVGGAPYDPPCTASTDPDGD